MIGGQLIAQRRNGRPDGARDHHGEVRQELARVTLPTHRRARVKSSSAWYHPLPRADNPTPNRPRDGIPYMAQTMPILVPTTTSMRPSPLTSAMVTPYNRT